MDEKFAKSLWKVVCDLVDYACPSVKAESFKILAIIITRLGFSDDLVSSS